MQFTTNSIRNQHHQQRKASNNNCTPITSINENSAEISECHIITRKAFVGLIYFSRGESCCASEPLQGKELVFFYTGAFPIHLKISYKYSYVRYILRKLHVYQVFFLWFQEDIFLFAYKTFVMRALCKHN